MVCLLLAFAVGGSSVATGFHPTKVGDPATGELTLMPESPAPGGEGEEPLPEFAWGVARSHPGFDGLPTLRLAYVSAPSGRHAGFRQRIDRPPQI